MSQFNLRYVPTLSVNELILNGQRVNTQGAIINGNITSALTTEIIINDDTKNQKLYEDILGLQGEIVGNVNPNLVVVNQRLTALEGNVLILQGNVEAIENDIVVIEGNIDTLEGDVVVLQNQINLLGNLEQGLAGNTQYLIAPYNGLAGNTSFFFKGLQVYNTPGLAINENTGTGIFSYLDDAGPTGQIQHRVQNNREFQIKNGTTRINPSTNGSVIIQTTDNSPFNFVMGNSSSTYEEQQAVNCNISGTVNIGLGFQAGPTTVTRGLEIKNTNDVLTTTLSGSDLNVFGGIGGAVNVYSQDGGQLNIQSNVATLSGGVVICGGGSQAILSCPGQTDVFGSSTNIASSENTNIFTENGKRIDINCDVGGLNSEINIGTLQTTAQTGYQIISIGSQPTVPLTTAQTSTFIYGDLYRPFPLSFNFPYDQMLFIGLPTPFSGPTNGPVKTTVNPFLRSISTFAPDFTTNSFIATSGFFTVNVGIGAISLNCGAGGFALSVVAGPLALTSLIGGVACTTGAGAIALTTGTGTVQISTGAAPIQCETVFGDILLKAGYGAAAVPETALGSIYLKSRNYTFITPDQAVVVGAGLEAPFNEVLINTLNYPFFGNLLTPPGLNGNSVFSNVFLTPNVKNSLVNPIEANLFYNGNVIGQTGSAQAFILYANSEVVTFSTVATVPYKGILEGNVIQGNIEPTRFTFDFTTELPINENLYVRIAPTTLIDANLELSRYGYGTWQSDTSIQSNIGVFINGFVEPPAPTYDRYLTVLDDASFLNDVECNSNILVKKDAFPLKNTTITNDSISTTGNITCNTLNYVTLNPPVGGGTPALQKGGLITNDGTTDVAFPLPVLSLNTTSSLYDWTLSLVGSLLDFTLTSTPNSFIQVGKNIRIRYNSTDFFDGTVQSVIGNVVNVLITVQQSAAYSRTNTLYTSFGTTTYSAQTLFPNRPAAQIPANSFIWDLGINYQSQNTFSGSTINATLASNPAGASLTTVDTTNPAGIATYNVQLGFITGKSLLFQGTTPFDFTVGIGGTGTENNIYRSNTNFQYNEIIRGFTVPYSSGTVELLSPLVLSSNINTSTSLEWQYPQGGGPTDPTITNTNTDATFFPVFVSGTGTQPLRADTTTGPFSFNPFNGNLNLVDTLKVNQTDVALGKGAGAVNQGVNTVAIGFNAGQNNQSGESIAIGDLAGQNNQGAESIAIGDAAGRDTQGIDAIAIGDAAGRTNQGANAVAIGASAGLATQGSASVAIGLGAGFNIQGANSVAVGQNSGQNNQGASSVAVGDGAGNSGLGATSIAIGRLAGELNQSANSICLNASGVALNPATTGLFIDPIRNVSQGNVIGYDTINKELTFFTAQSIPVLTKGELITNDGTNDVALDAPSSTIITTTTVYDWTGPTFIGTTKVYTMSSVANLRLTDVIRINYSLTDFVEGTITNITGNNVSLLISNQGNQAYLSNAFYTNQDGSTLYTFTPVLNSETNLPSACIVTGFEGNFQQNPFGTAATVSATFNTASSGNLASLPFFIPGGGFGPSFFTANLSVPAGSGVFVNNPSPFTISFSSPGSTSISWRITSTGNFYWGVILGYTLAYSSGTVENLSFPLPPFILQANPLTSTGLEWQISQSTLDPYAGTGINNLSYDPLTKRLFQAELNANFFEDFWINIFGTSTTEFGQTLVFNETGTGVSSRFNGVIKPAAITGSLGRRGFIQINSGGTAGNSSFLKTPNEIAISTIKKVTFGILCSANENLATNATAAGNIQQAVGITAATNATNVQTTDTIIWRLSSNSGTLPGWQFIINNTLQYSLVMTPIGQSDSWVTCGFEILNMNLTNNTFQVRGFWKNMGTGVSEFTPIISCGVGAAGNLANFPTNLQDANEVGLYAMSGTNNATNKYLGVDYVFLESQNLFQVINI